MVSPVPLFSTGFKWPILIKLIQSGADSETRAPECRDERAGVSTAECVALMLAGLGRAPVHGPRLFLSALASYPARVQSASSIPRHRAHAAQPP